MHIALPIRVRLVVCIAALFAAFGAPPSAVAFDVGFNDFDLTHYADGTEAGDANLATGLAHASAAGATWWRLGLYWSAVAPTRPANPSDPAAPEYRWDQTDRIVRAVGAARLKPILWFGNAPAWAEGAGRPPASDLVPAGTWKPDAAAFRSFTQAVASRYDGTFADPQRPGQVLPRIAVFQGWNEPNLYTNLTPQWEKPAGKWRLTAADTYRDLQNAAFDGVKAAQPSSTVLSAGTGPYGDLEPGQPRSGPALLWRTLLCVKASGARLTGSRACPTVRFDAWSHHPYSVGGPTENASNRDDAVVPDIPKLARILEAGARAGTITRASVRNRWVTELSWDSKPDPRGLSPSKQASYMSQAFYELWKSGVKTVIWWNSRDDARGPDWSLTLQSGVYYRGSDPAQDRPKPSLDTYRFPFATGRSGNTTTLWAAAPKTGRVAFQRRRGSRWVELAVRRAGPDRVVTSKIVLPRGTRVRAVQGAIVSPSVRTR